MTGPGWPDQRGWLVILSAGIFVYVLTLVAFVPDLDDSQLFTALAAGVGGAVFRDVIGMWTSSTKTGSELASKAMDTLHNQTSSTSGPTKTDEPQEVTVVNPPTSPVQIEETRS